MNPQDHPYWIEEPYSIDHQDLFGKLQSTQEGLGSSEVNQRKELLGPNSLKEQKQKSIWLMAWEQFKSPIVWLLALASGVSFFFQHWLEGYSIIGVIFINALIGFLMELQARRSINALRELDVSHSKVLRDHSIHEVPSEELTVGDVMLLEAGDIVVADGRIFEVHQLEIDESALTGESLPVTKKVETLDKATGLGDQDNMVFKGTAVVKGNAKVLVTGIGAHTELGKISNMVENASTDATPLEKKLQELTQKLIWLTLVFAAIFVTTGLLQGKEVFVIFETAIALAVAAIPEGLPIVATLALTYGMLRMARKNVLIKRLASVETLGGTNIIFTDKTGTLTENKIEVDTLSLMHKNVALKNNKGLKEELGAEHHGNLERLFQVCVLCNNADLKHDENGDHKHMGDPIEIAMLQWVREHRDLQEIKGRYPRVAEIAFSSETKIMGTLHQDGDGFLVVGKGAVEELIHKCNRYANGDQIHNLEEAQRGALLQKAEELQKQGLRALAFGYKETKEGKHEDFLNEMVFVGTIGFLDPPRMDVAEALKACREAGIKVIMITGDHPATALNIAEKIQLAEKNVVLGGKDLEKGLPDEQLREVNIFARVTPKQKLDMVTLYQKRGDIVAMTGDGINDAPAIKKADVGIAMGLRGTPVAKETADVILKEDSFTAIVSAIEQGRTIFQNIKRFMVYLLSCNLSEILIVFVLGLFNASFTLMPLQILFLNILTDIFPALALGMGKGNALSMKQMPRKPGQAILSRKDWILVMVYAASITVSVLGTSWWDNEYLHWDPKVCNNIAFLSLAFAQLWHVFNLPSSKLSFWNNEVTRNAFVWWALLLCTVLMLLFYAFEPTRAIIGLQILPLRVWLVILGASLIPVVIVFVLKRVLKLFE